MTTFAQSLHKSQLNLCNFAVIFIVRLLYTQLRLQKFSEGGKTEILKLKMKVSQIISQQVIRFLRLFQKNVFRKVEGKNFLEYW